MVFGAGLGTRMMPLTADKPKPLVEVCGKPMIEYTFDKLKEFGIKKVVVNTHYKPEKLQNYIKGYKGLNIEYIHEDVLLNTGGGLLQALPLLGKEPFFVINGDIVWRDKSEKNSLLQSMIEIWDSKTKAVLVLQTTKNAIGYDGNGDFFLSDKNEILVNNNAKTKPYVFTGIQLLRPELLDEFELSPFSLIEVYKKNINNSGVLEGVKGLVMKNSEWFHIGTPDGVDLAEKIMKQKVREKNPA